MVGSWWIFFKRVNGAGRGGSFTTSNINHSFITLETNLLARCWCKVWKLFSRWCGCIYTTHLWRAGFTNANESDECRRLDWFRSDGDWTLEVDELYYCINMEVLCVVCFWLLYAVVLDVGIWVSRVGEVGVRVGVRVGGVNRVVLLLLCLL